jgi:F420-dependent oxidoreductase-like protein
VKLAIKIGYSGSDFKVPIDLIRHAESLGYDSVWTSESYGSDAVSPAAWILAQTTRIKVGTAIMQMAARTPTMAAMTAMTLAALSGNRFMLGIGASGPQVVEGWHGERFGRPITRLKEYATIVRKVIAREAALTFEGKEYQIPYRGADATGLGKPLKSILHCEKPIPIYTATITPAGVEAAAEVADGFFPIWMDPEQYHVFADPIAKGFARSPGKSLASFDIAPFVTVSVGDDIAQCMQPIRAAMALYIGGMGARSKNFYNDYTKRLGFEAAAGKIQDLFLSGKKEEAAAAVPDALIDACHLVGPAARIRERAARWVEANQRGQVGTMVIGCRDPKALELIADVFRR